MSVVVSSTSDEARYWGPWSCRNALLATTPMTTRTTISGNDRRTAARIVSACAGDLMAGCYGGEETTVAWIRAPLGRLLRSTPYLACLSLQPGLRTAACFRLSAQTGPCGG